jgi:hypothetical protein
MKRAKVNFAGAADTVARNENVNTVEVKVVVRQAKGMSLTDKKDAVVPRTKVERKKCE